MIRGATVEINLKNLSLNLKKIKKKAGRRPVIAVVKADAYGHGAREISKKLIAEGINIFGVAYLNEAIELRESGIKKEILVFFDQDITPEIVDYNLTPVVNSLQYARELSGLAKKSGRTINCHINIDTGMGRMGLNGTGLLRDLNRILSMEGLKVRGIMSHFSDADLKDPEIAYEQAELFRSIKERLNLTDTCIFHMANSAATVNLDDAFFDAVRPGLIIYGVNPFSKDKFYPLMTVKTRIMSLRRLKKGTSVSYGRTFITTRDSLVGVVPLGYADGLLRRASNRTEFLVQGRRVPVIGRICMDLTMVDLTDIKNVSEGDEVVVIGKQGEQEITAQELAEKTSTIPYEVLTSLGRLNKRVFV